MKKTKQTTAQRKARRAEQIEIIFQWCRLVRKHIKLPDNLTGTLHAMVDASRQGELTVHIYQVGPALGQLIVQKQNDLLPDLKFWMVGAPKEKTDDKTPSLRYFVKRKQDVSVYAGNRYICVTIPIKRSELTKKELRQLFA